MDGHEQAAAAEGLKGAHGSLGAHVDVAPEGIGSADFKHGEIEWAELIADLSEAIPFTGVGAIVDAVRGAVDSEGCPQSLKPVEEAAA